MCDSMVPFYKHKRLMQKYADYIKRIEIDSLWSGKKHIIWELNRQVNILSGSNGQGKMRSGSGTT